MVLTNQNLNNQNFDIDTDALKETQRIVLEVLNSGWFERDYKQWFYSVADPQGRFDLVPDKSNFKKELKKLKTELDLNSEDYDSHFKSKVGKSYYKKDDDGVISNHPFKYFCDAEDGIKTISIETVTTYTNKKYQSTTLSHTNFVKISKDPLDKVYKQSMEGLLVDLLVATNFQVTFDFDDYKFYFTPVPDISQSVVGDIDEVVLSGDSLKVKRYLNSKLDVYAINKNQIKVGFVHTSFLKTRDVFFAAGLISEDDFFSEIRKEVEESFSEMISEILLSTDESEYKNFAYHLPPFVRNKTKFYSDIYSTLVSDNTNFASKLLISVLNNDSIKKNFFKLIETMLESSDVNFNFKLLTDVSTLISLIDETYNYYIMMKIPRQDVVFDREMTEKDLEKLKRNLVKVLKYQLSDSEFISEQEIWGDQKKLVSLRARNFVDVCAKYLPKASLTKLCKNSLKGSLTTNKLRLVSLSGRDIVNISIEDVDSRLLISFVSLLEKGLSRGELNSTGKSFAVEIVKSAKDLVRRIKGINTTFGLDSKDRSLLRSFLREFKANYDNSMSLTILEELDFKQKVVILDLEDVVFDKSWGTFEESVALLSLRDFGRRFKRQGTQLILCEGKGDVATFFKNNSYKEFIYCDSLKKAKSLPKTF